MVLSTFRMKLLGYSCPLLSTDLEWFLRGIQCIAVIHAGSGVIPFFQEGPASIIVSEWSLEAISGKE